MLLLLRLSLFLLLLLLSLSFAIIRFVPNCWMLVTVILFIRDDSSRPHHLPQGHMLAQAKRAAVPSGEPYFQTIDMECMITSKGADAVTIFQLAKADRALRIQIVVAVVFDLSFVIAIVVSVFFCVCMSFFNHLHVFMVRALVVIVVVCINIACLQQGQSAGTAHAIVVNCHVNMVTAGIGSFDVGIISISNGIVAHIVDRVT
mmetsp:Transcript_18198/g.51859  ORF Transcript_18198/g.51859 Transcript_18198/m.51859 type:complete len:203 (-) Transcript_18198:386-994(-)